MSEQSVGESYHEYDDDAGRELRGTMPAGNSLLGRVVACSGAHAKIAAVASDGGTDLTELWSVGRLISISVGRNRIAALVVSMNTNEIYWQESVDNAFIVDVELLGEVYVDETGKETFSTGISRYPYLGAVAHRMRSSDLRRIYDVQGGQTCVIGSLTQDESIEAAIHIPSMLSKHFAVVGSTGVGKSTTVSLLLRKAVETDPKLRVLILDPHNEFAAAFPDIAEVIETETLDLPFWLMRLEEFSEVIFRGRPAVPEELDFLRDLIPDAKKSFRGESAYMRKQNERSAITADTPVPYRISDLLALIDERIGRLEGKEEKPHLRSLKLRIMAAVNDPRYHFMFRSNTISDNIMETVQTIFRIPGDGKPIATFQLSGIPSEVVNSVASVLTRMAFEIGLWSNGAVHLLVVCEEAHRYVPADPSLGFAPTRQAIARIAKEGRKYGVSLGVITQRPGELDQTILSQCSTVFAMRLANDRDQEIIRSAIPDSSASTMSFISSIGNGEAIAFGEAVAVPMRMKFTRIPETALPKAQTAIHEGDMEAQESVDLKKIIGRMRATDSRPDISDFQERYEAATRPQVADVPAYVEQEDLHAIPTAREPAPLEHYSPDMLPGSHSMQAEAAVAAERPREYQSIRRTPPPAATPQYPRTTMQDPPPLQPAHSSQGTRPQGMSLRESILKKPLSSLRRD